MGITADAAKKTVEQMEKQSYLIRSGDHLQAHKEFNNGALTVNGKTVGAQ